MFELIALWTVVSACQAPKTQPALFVEPAQQVAEIQPCVWPNRCAVEEQPAVLAQVRPCVWPNRCKDEAQTAVVAQYKPCVWPNRCAAETGSLFVID